jgi:hypothetical protein
MEVNREKNMTVAGKAILAALMSACPLVWAHAESVVTLKSGETLQGEILSDTNGTLQIRAFSANHSIEYVRGISDSDIQGIHTETPAEIAERTDYEGLSRFQLDPNQEQTVGWYNQWIGALQKFVRNYPDSDRLSAIRHEIALCQAESRHVASGEVKFDNRWMTTEEKRLAVAKSAIEALKSRLSDLQKRRDKLAKDVELVRSNLQSVQNR